MAMLKRIKIALTENELSGLEILARAQRRWIEAQAAVIVHDELERRGLIKMDSITITEDPNALKIGEPHD